MKLDPNAPAHPFRESNEFVQYPDTQFPGLTIRAEIASRVLAGFVANPASTEKWINNHAVASSVAMADALIAELNKD